MEATMTTDQNHSPRAARVPAPDGGPPRGLATAGRLPPHVRVMRRLSGRGLPPPVCDVGVERGIGVPAADGVPLITDHYVPLSGGPWPTLLVRWPVALLARLAAARRRAGLASRPRRQPGPDAAGRGRGLGFAL
jgi:predicted acyl esterase